MYIISKWLPVVTVIVFGQQAIDKARLKGTDIGHVQTDKAGLDHIVQGMEDGNVFPQARFIIIMMVPSSGNRRTDQFLQGILTFVGITGGQLKETRDTEDGNGSVKGRQGRGQTTTGGDQTAVGQDGMGR